MSIAGWYPDPGGQPGKFRYWNGQTWSEQVTDNPASTPPPPSAAGPAAATPYATQSRKRNTGWWIAGAIGVLVIGLVIWGLTRVVPALTGGDNPWDPGGNATFDICDTGMTGPVSTPAIPTRPGQVSTLHLSYPTLSTPWNSPSTDNRVPFGTVVVGQVATDQLDYDGNGNNWVSSVILADLASGDGFSSAQNAAELSYRCILGKFYGDNTVDSKIITSEARTVDGHSAWYIEGQLSFRVPGLTATGERVIVLVVNVSNDTYSMYYGSVPNTSEARLPEVRAALKELTVYE
ncbi:MAG TPA: DUF2510 domain-containing protein [Propionicimonas sp.]|nr:DUF2510 domain-containing protein [Propionicimonas sp.]